MKTLFYYFITLITTLFFSNGLKGQSVSFDEFYRNEITISPIRSISIIKSFSTSSKFYPFSKKEELSNLLVSGNVKFLDKSGLVRIVLTDNNNNEYLIYENSYFLSDTNYIVFEKEYFETAYLPAITPKNIEVIVSGAELFINSFDYNIFNETSKIHLNSAKVDLINSKNLSTVEQLNYKLKKRNFKWIAGETGISKMRYQDKKQYYGDTIPNLYGLEYYKAGFFEFPKEINNSQTLKSITKSASLNSNVGITSKTSIASTLNTTSDVLVKNFDWRNRHGKNWNTSVKDQGTCGSCWAHSVVAATEGQANLFYNQLLNLDLSEQHLLSCSKSGDCSTAGGWIDAASSFVKITGVVDEICYPYYASKTTCRSALNPNERIKLTDYYIFKPKNSQDPVAELKKYIIKNGIIATDVWTLDHAMALVGFGTVKPNQTICTDANFQITCTTIQYSDTQIIGQTYWIFKNSHSVDWGMSGYGYFLIDINNFWMNCIPTYPIISQNYTAANIVCEDNDLDGYYNWGISTKPTACPVSPALEDGDDSNSTLGPLDQVDFTTSVNLPYTYSFESPSDLWVQSSSDNFDWYFTNSTSRINQNTGPVSAYDGSWYLLANAQYNTPNKTAIITGPSINLMNACNSNLSFNYHMFGSGMGSLALQLSTDGGNTWSANIWSVSGNQGDIWKNSSIDISPYNGNMLKFRFIATTVSSSLSSMAIDNIKIIPAIANTNLVISTSQTWSDFRNLCQNLVIQGSTVLTIKGEIIMPDESLITIKNGSELVVDAGKIINSKVVVESGGKLTLKNNGLLIINNDDITVNLGGLSDLLFGEVRKKNN